MFKVFLKSEDFNWYLKGTTWTTEINTASSFESREDAQKALDKAKKYMVPARRKLAQIIEMV